MHNLHNFSITTVSDKTIMFCSKCGHSFTLYTNAKYAEWRFIPFKDEGGGEYGTINMPSCLDIAKSNQTTYQDAKEKGLL